MKLTLILLSLIISACCFAQKQENKAAQKIVITSDETTLNSQWNGKRVAFLGDSMTDKRRIGTSYIYWEYLEELLGIEPFVYGISGNQWDGIYKQAIKLHQEHQDNVDAILIFAGTNDYNQGIPIGNFFRETIKETNHNGKISMRKYRIPCEDDSTFCGRINKAMTYLKNNFPQQQIILMTPIHRGYARFNDKNVQPDENYANAQGLFIDSYISTLKEAATIWAVPVIDLFSLSGLYPLADSHAQYFNQALDKLHPNASGDYRLAKTIQYQLLGLPAGFVSK
jgi:lysophospholipase L1-like esterase